jgi:uncharacterized protein (TIGR02246 family)
MMTEIASNWRLIAFAPRIDSPREVMKILVLIAVLAGALLAAQETKTPATSKTEHAGNFNAKVDQVRDTWAKAYNNRNAAKIAELYAPDATMVGPDGMTHGRAAIEEAFQEDIKAGYHDFSVMTQKRERSGDLAYEIGTYAEKNNNGGPVHGTYLVVLKQIAGKWLIAAIYATEGTMRER